MNSFQSLLLGWYQRSKRSLPWRKTTNEYAILVSEVMLQQTQVDRVVPKYESWLEAFPDWNALASASRQAVLRSWSGLGYNNRAFRLQQLARVVVKEHNGRLPRAPTALVQLPGIGSYTAGALQVFAWKKPAACVDVNVERVVRRAFIGRRQKNVSHAVLARAFLDSYPRGKAREYANAFMDLGSEYCTATRPRCNECPVRAACKTRGEHPDDAPLRAKRRQSTFLQSNRWWRGQVLKALAHGSRDRAGLFQTLKKSGSSTEKKAFDAAIAQLHSEGVVSGVKRLSVRE